MRLVIIIIFIIANLFAHLLPAQAKDVTPEEKDVTPEEKEAQAQIEPPFPQVFDSISAAPRRIHIASEWLSGEYGYQTSEEYLDSELGKNTQIMSTKGEQYSLHIDAKDGLIYQITPYKCTTFKSSEILSGFQGMLHAKFEFDGEDKEMHVYGVAAVWLNAARKSKSYSLVDQAIKGSVEVHKKLHKWSVYDDVSEQKVQLYFSESGHSNRLSLDMIQFESIHDSGHFLRTINILSYENLIRDEDVGLLQLPVGFGCGEMRRNTGTDPMAGWLEAEKLVLFRQLKDSYRIQLQVSATDFTNPTSKSASQSVDLIRAKSPGNNNKFMLQVKVKTNKADIKTIVDNYFGVKYEIDLRQDSCTISNHKPDTNEREPVKLDFENGLSLPIDAETLKFLLIETKNYPVKTIKEGMRLYHYFEQTTNELLGDKTCRIIRVYTTIDKQEGSRAILDSVSVLVLNSAQDEIENNFQLNVLDIGNLDSKVEIARLFDVSEECYLNNDKMQNGRDYAWFNFYYPIQSHQSELLATQTNLIKETLYSIIEDYSLIDGPRIPRIEIMFDDTAMIVRILMLDEPSLHLIYRLYPKTELNIAGSMDELAVDLSHCSDLCRINVCQTMTYCDVDHRCLINTDSLDSHIARTDALSINQVCNTYGLQIKDGHAIEDIINSGLHRYIDEFRDQDYESVEVPALPEELMYPMRDTGVSLEDFKRIVKDYTSQLYDGIGALHYMKRMMIMTLTLRESFIILKPNKFELEQDPLEDFELIDGSSDGDNILSGFHKGLTMNRYRRDAFDLEPKKRFMRSFTGLNYEQCALACQDNKCSSLSYCVHRFECIITDIYDITNAPTSLIEIDAECFIAQRDFLSKFNKFTNVYRPQIYKQRDATLNPSECAHRCIVSSEFNCLAFDYCESGAGSKQADSCFLLEERILFTGGSNDNKGADESGKDKVAKGVDEKTGCAHYSRSYLADFVRLQGRRLSDPSLAKLDTSSYKGRSVDKCAEICANELPECSAFQFCFEPEEEGAKQSCLMIEGRREGKDSGEENAAAASENEASGNEFMAKVNGSDSDGSILEAGKVFVPNNYCHVFSLRKDASEAQSRDMAFDIEDISNADRQEQVVGGLSVGTAILLYLLLASITAAMGFSVCASKQHQDYLRQKVERIRLLLGF